MNKPELSKADRIAKLLDQNPVPGTDFRIGLDGIIGLIPGVGDILTMRCRYILLLASKEGVSATIMRMLLNIGLDQLIGMFPLIGDIADFFWKANSKNVALWKNSVSEDTSKKQTIIDTAFMVLVFSILAILLVSPLLLTLLLLVSSRAMKLALVQSYNPLQRIKDFLTVITNAVLEYSFHLPNTTHHGNIPIDQN